MLSPDGSRLYVTETTLDFRGKGYLIGVATVIDTAPLRLAEILKIENTKTTQGAAISPDGSLVYMKAGCCRARRAGI